MSEPIRVLQVFAQMNRGGAETMVMNLYRNIDRSKIQFDFIVHTEEKCAFDDEIKKLGGRIFRVPRYNGKNHFLYTKIWREFIRNHPEYKIVHGHVRSTASIYLKICKKHNRTTIAHSHSTSSGSGIKSKIKNVMQYPIRNIADCFFACSTSAGEWLFGREIIKKRNYYLLNNSIEIKKYRYSDGTRTKIRQHYNLTNKFVVGHVGRFDQFKNHDFLIDVFEEIKKTNKEAVLLLVGDGELKNKIQEKVIQLNLSDAVIFTGVRSDIPDLLQAMDTFIFPSLHEGLGIATIEAQAAGLPTLVSEAIPEEAFVTDLIQKEQLNHSTEAWANKVTSSAEKFKRRNTYKELKAAGYDIEENVEWLEKFYLSCYKEAMQQIMEKE